MRETDRQTDRYTDFAPGRWANYCDYHVSVFLCLHVCLSVCLFVCLSVCLLAYCDSDTSKFHHISVRYIFLSCYWVSFLLWRHCNTLRKRLPVWWMTSCFQMLERMG